MLEFKKAGSGYQINGVIMRHDYRILHDMLINGRIGTNEFKERIDAIKLGYIYELIREVHER